MQRRPKTNRTTQNYVGVAIVLFNAMDLGGRSGAVLRITRVDSWTLARGGTWQAGDDRLLTGPLLDEVVRRLQHKVPR